MQTLWSRVAQVRGACRCPQCAPCIHGVTRRATASATRRMPRYLTSSTLWYSGIFAAAATFDAGIKQQRREKWDQAIAEVKQELAQPQQATRQEQAESRLQVEEGAEDEPALFMPFGEGDGGDEFQYTDGETQADWPANTGAPLDDFLAPNSIYTKKQRRAAANALRWTPKKLAMAQTSMDIMLLELMHDFHAGDKMHLSAEWMARELHRAALDHPEQINMHLDEKKRRLAILKKADAWMNHYTLPDAPEKELEIPEDKNPLCRFDQDETYHFRAIQWELNSSLQHLFKLHAQERVDTASMIGRIVYNLRRSSAPPNTDTYNILLLGFSKAEELRSFKHALVSFRRCNMRPNEITLATVLNHFTKVDDPSSFAHWIELIRGGHNGLALARADVEINEESSKRLVHHQERPEKIIQLPHHNPLVFGAMIAGVLNFAGFQSALQICQSMGQEGWGLCMAGLTPLLHDCVRRKDWKAGSAVWDQIKALKAQSKRKEDSRWLTERIRLDTFAAMLRLCLKCNKRDTFDEVWAAALKSHRGATNRLLALIKGAGTRRYAAVEDSIDEAVVMAHGEETEMEKIGRAERARSERTARQKPTTSFEKARQWHAREHDWVADGLRKPYVEYIIPDLEDPIAGEEQIGLAKRVVLPNEDVLATAMQTETLPRYQSTTRVSSGRPPVLGKPPENDMRVILSGEDSVASAEESGTFPRHQAITHILPGMQPVRGADDMLAGNALESEAFHERAPELSFLACGLAVREPIVMQKVGVDMPETVRQRSSAEHPMEDYFEYAELGGPTDILRKPLVEARAASKTVSEQANAKGSAILAVPRQSWKRNGAEDPQASSKEDQNATAAFRYRARALFFRKHHVGIRAEGDSQRDGTARLTSTKLHGVGTKRLRIHVPPSSSQVEPGKERLARLRE